MTTLTHQRTARHAVLLAGTLLVAANLRVPATGLPPLLGPITEHFGLSTAAAGALTTLPLLAFALLSPFAAAIARRLGLERALLCAMATIALGIGLRSSGWEWALYLGTWILGMGIAVGNVLLPGLVKRDFPDNVAAITGAYVLSMGVVAALGSAVAVPLADAYGWQAALAGFIVVPLAAMAVWATQWRSASVPSPVDARTQPPVPIWRCALAWQITFYLGLNSTIYYVAIGWLPSILAESGVSAQQAGTLHGVLQLASAIPGLVLGPIVQRMTDQRLAAALAAAMSAMALLGFWLLPTLSWLWAVLFGVGTGATFILGLTFVALRTRDVAQSTALSGMSQSVGYLLAAVAPMAMGALHDRLGGWQVPLLGCAALAAVAVVMGALAGRNRQIAA